MKRAISAIAIGVTASNGHYRLLHTDDKLLFFIEGFDDGFEGYEYAASNQAHMSTFFSPKDLGVSPNYIVGFKPLAAYR